MLIAITCMAVALAFVLGMALEARWNVLGTAKLEALKAYDHAAQMALSSHNRIVRLEDELRVEISRLEGAFDQRLTTDPPRVGK
jgi:hypothetical protein